MANRANPPPSGSNLRSHPNNRHQPSNLSSSLSPDEDFWSSGLLSESRLPAEHHTVPETSVVRPSNNLSPSSLAPTTSSRFGAFSSVQPPLNRSHTQTSAFPLLDPNIYKPLPTPASSWAASSPLEASSSTNTRSSLAPLASAASSTANLASTSRYAAERKRRLSSLASSPESSPYRRPTAAPSLSSELLRESLLRRNTGGSLGEGYRGRINAPVPEPVHSEHPLQQTSDSEYEPAYGRTYRARIEGRGSTYSNMSTSAVVPSPSWTESQASGSTRNSANPILIDLTGEDDSAPSSRMPPGQSSDPTRGSHLLDEVELPRWQPDSEASSCPVCGRQFTFLFRKHHCR
jgi:FYVE zinc finger